MILSDVKPVHAMFKRSHSPLFVIKQNQPQQEEKGLNASTSSFDVDSLAFFKPSSSSPSPCDENGNGEESKENYQNKEKKRVAFKERVRIRVIPRAMDLVEEPGTLWYQKHEYRDIKQRIRSLVHAIENDTVLLERGRRLCTRGIERHFEQPSIESEKTRILSRNAVFVEQSCQRKDKGRKVGKGISHYNDEAIANAYKQVTYHAQVQANRLAVNDAMEVRKILRGEDPKRSNK